MKRTTFAIAVLAVAAWLTPVASAAAATPTVTFQDQAWWRLAGISVPSQVGSHIHVEVTIPQDGYPVDGVITVPVKVIAHAQIGRIVRLRVDNEKGVISRWPVNLGPCDDCTWTGTVTVDLSKWPTGRHEMRWRGEIPDNSEGNEQNSSSGAQVCVRSCSPSYRSGPWFEARGWYTGHGYQNARLTSVLSTVRSGGTIKVALKPGSGGKTTKFSGIYIDPDMHAGDPGIVVRQSNGTFSGSVTLPTLPAGAHKLVLLASDGQNAGVLLIPFVTP